jgi:uncharacterized OB-fold protein
MSDRTPDLTVTPQPDEIELPPVDGVTQPWWDATREQKLLVQRCNTCGKHQHYPRALCTACGGTSLGWTEASGTGTVDSFTVVHRGLPGFATPYVVARVRLTEGVVLLTNLLDADDIACDAPVVLRWRPLSDGRHLPVFATPQASATSQAGGAA